jgi:hypothetical protein
MDIYVTKKVENAEDFAFDTPHDMPYMHVLTPPVIIKCDHNDNFFIAECPSDPNFMSGLIKIKKVITKSMLKQEDIPEKEKYKLRDDILWVKQSPMMIYKNKKTGYGTLKMLLNTPLSLQLSFKADNFSGIPKPYNLYNMYWTIDYVHVADDFNWSILA